jgi:hypothetical protein
LTDWYLDRCFTEIIVPLLAPAHKPLVLLAHIALVELPSLLAPAGIIQFAPNQICFKFD